MKRFLLLRDLVLVFWLTAILLAVKVQGSDAVRFEPYQYDYQGQRVKAELGRFMVPEQYDHPSGRKITLAFLRLKSTSPHPGLPVIYLAGGPGGSAIHLVKGPRGIVFLAMREAGDVIALEQRGVGPSEPNLDCPGTLGFPLTSPGDRRSLLAVFNERSRECADYWRTPGFELAAYNVVESAHDVNSLRQALGVKKIRLWGSSYGTTLGLAVIRYHGANVERLMAEACPLSALRLGRINS